ncbi:hypothetical protein [Oceaniglobus roseus]|uniref:hypothetical protein n=1 Tax=Oceaniglobus roseus TaxID=1737570 RepID=UPI000C7E8F48|nr:hypothetical protein [Kandeliimicrobium roseum]
MAYFDLGAYRRPVTASGRKAAKWFNRGLVWCYGFNHEEAVLCFNKALAADPGCAMAHWGIAWAVGPNYNKGWEDLSAEARADMVETAQRHLGLALSLAGSCTPVELALIGALAARYPRSPQLEDYAPFHTAFARAMRPVQRAFPNDLDVIAITAEAMMNRTPWQLWDTATGTPAEGSDTLEAKALLEHAFARVDGAWDHPGLLHMYIHLMEMSPTPELALRHGDRLAVLVPDAGHLIHMGTHIDVLTGDYQNVVARNQRASIADERFRAYAGPDNFYTLYRAHNYSFTLYGAMFLGQKRTALAAAEALIGALPESILRPYADWFEAFIPKKQHAMIRFGMWAEILDQPLPRDAELYRMTTAMTHYARAIAFANTGRPKEAQKAAQVFEAARLLVPETRLLFNNTCADLLAIAERMMLGEMAYHEGQHARAFDHLRAAVALDDGLHYDEPWGWLQPARHALGALLLEQGHLDEAEAVYRADLGLDGALPRPCQHPGNVWSLHGLNECLERRGETVERPHVRAQLAKALARADVRIGASCFCRARR